MEDVILRYMRDYNEKPPVQWLIIEFNKVKIRNHLFPELQAKSIHGVCVVKPFHYPSRITTGRQSVVSSELVLNYVGDEQGDLYSSTKASKVLFSIFPFRFIWIQMR